MNKHKKKFKKKIQTTRKNINTKEKDINNSTLLVVG